MSLCISRGKAGLFQQVPKAWPYIPRGEPTRLVLGARNLRERCLDVVRECAKRLGLEHIAPHDLRRTCAKLCHSNGGELEQIQFLLGHASVLTTERYLGSKQNLEEPVNDRFGPLYKRESSDIGRT
jgi:integrase